MWWQRAGHNLETEQIIPGGSDDKEFICNIRDLGSIPRSERSPGGWVGYPIQYSYLETLMDRGVWQAIVHGISNSQTWLKD